MVGSAMPALLTCQPVAWLPPWCMQKLLQPPEQLPPLFANPQVELLDDQAAAVLREVCLSFYDVRATAVEVVARLDLLSRCAAHCTAPADGPIKVCMLCAGQHSRGKVDHTCLPAYLTPPLLMPPRSSAPQPRQPAQLRSPGGGPGGAADVCTHGPCPGPLVGCFTAGGPLLPGGLGPPAALMCGMPGCGLLWMALDGFGLAVLELAAFLRAKAYEHAHTLLQAPWIKFKRYTGSTSCSCVVFWCRSCSLSRTNAQQPGCGSRQWPMPTCWRLASGVWRQRWSLTPASASWRAGWR